MTISRRKFIKRGAGILGMCLSPSAIFSLAAPDAAAGTPKIDAKTLVVIHLNGGNDGLNTVVPFGRGRYYDARPDLAITQSDVLSLNNSIGLHPAMNGMADLFQRGKLAIVQAVGYPQTNRSHFRASQIWQTARPDQLEETGWLGRYVDLRGNSKLALSIDSVLPQALVARVSAVRCVSDDDVRFKNGGESKLANRLSLVSNMIVNQSPTKIFHLNVDGFDTHANQGRVQAPLLKKLSSAISAFQADLEYHKMEDQVITLVFSEFGRRLAENGGCGTDHGTAGPVFIIGGSVRGGIYGDDVDLANLDDGDLRYNLDFRMIYATILDRWLGADSAEVLGSNFEHIRFV